MALEMGKPLAQGPCGDPKNAPGLCEYYAENAESQLAPDLIATNASTLVCGLRANGCHPRRDAVEFSVLAGLSIWRLQR